MKESFLTPDECLRYSRQLKLDGFGEECQMRLRGSRVLVIGAGALGSPVALYLAAAGVGHIDIADGDIVDLSNLQRQIIHRTADLSRPKAVSAMEKMSALNPEIEVRAIEAFATADNIGPLVAAADFVVDATDSLDAKFLIDDACREVRKPYSHGAVRGYEGQTMTVVPGSATYRDLFPDGPELIERVAMTGPLGVVPGIIGAIQAAEAVKCLAGIGDLLTDSLLRFNALTMNFQKIRLR